MRKIMVGLLHNEDGEPIIRAPRTLKVGIGIPKGRAIRVLIHRSRKWMVVIGAFAGQKLKETPHTFDTRQEAEAFYHAHKDEAPIVAYPRKLPYFTFSRPVVAPDGGAGYEPDFDAIEAAGPEPTDIRIVFMTAAPFEGAYRLWTQTELKCSGDGIDAMRAVSMEPDNPAAIQARNAGLKVFPIEGGCWTRGCPYAKNECKVTSSLSFHVADSVRIGGTAFFQTTGYRSTTDLFSSLHEIETIVRMTTGRGIIGIPLRLKLRPYITKHEGKAATQYAVRIEMDSIEIGKLQARLQSQTIDTAMQIAAPVVETEAPEPFEIDEEPPPLTDDFDDEGPAPPPVVINAAVASAVRQEAMAEKLRSRETEAAEAPVQV